MIKQEVKEQIKTDIKHWFKENFPKCIVKKKSLKEIVRTIKHEIIHYNISNKFVKSQDIELTISFQKENSLQFSYSAKCSCRYPLIYSLLRYYPKYIFIEFIQYLYDMIDNVFSLRKIEYLMRYTTHFIKTLFRFRNKV